MVKRKVMWKRILMNGNKWMRREKGIEMEYNSLYEQKEMEAEEKEKLINIPRSRSKRKFFKGGRKWRK